MAEEKSTTEKVADGALLMLDAERVVTFKEGKFIYSYCFSRITQADWEQFFDGILFTSRNAGKGEETMLDMETPGVDLVERKLLRVEGYAGDFMNKVGWQARMPPKHLRPAAILLRGVSDSKSALERPVDPESMEVSLDAAWGLKAPGEMAAYEGLVHRFAPVTAEQKRRFFRAGAVSRVVGGSRNGTTIHAMRHRVLLRIYDELILGVEGYGIAGSPLKDRDHICREMDGYHKVKAAELLFTGSGAEADYTSEAAETLFGGENAGRTDAGR